MHVCIVFISVKHRSKYKLSDEYYFRLNINISQIKDFWTYNMKNFSAVYYRKFKWHTWKTPPQPYILNIAKSTVCSGCGRSGPWVVPRTFSEQEQHSVDSGFHRRPRGRWPWCDMAPARPSVTSTAPGTAPQHPLTATGIGSNNSKRPLHCTHKETMVFPLSEFNKSTSDYFCMLINAELNNLRNLQK